MPPAMRCVVDGDCSPASQAMGHAAHNVRPAEAGASHFLGSYHPDRRWVYAASMGIGHTAYNGDRQSCGLEL